jgi:type III secretion apparatus needle protein
MAIANAQVGLNLTDVSGTMTNAIEQQSSNIMSQLNSIQADGANVSPAQLVQMQAYVQLWSSMIELESSIVKVYSDTMKQVVTNISS